MITEERQLEAKATTIQVVYYDQVNNIDFVSCRRASRGLITGGEVGSGYKYRKLQPGVVKKRSPGSPFPAPLWPALEAVTPQISISGRSQTALFLPADIGDF